MFQKSGPFGQVFWKKAPFLICAQPAGQPGILSRAHSCRILEVFNRKNPGSQAFPNPLDEDKASLRIKHDPMTLDLSGRLGRLPGSRLSSSKLTSLNLNVRKVKFWGEAPPKTDRSLYTGVIGYITPISWVSFTPPSYPSFVGYDSWHVHKLLGIWGLGRKTATSFCWQILVVQHQKNMLILEDLIETKIGGISQIFLSNS